MAKTLSAKDTHVLSLLSLHLPSHPLTHQSDPYPSPSQPSFSSSASSHPSHLATHEASILAPLNQPSPSPSALNTAITDLTTLIASHPSYASAYNNRAQANRMLHGDDLRSETVQRAGTWEDLTKAIALAEGEAGREIEMAIEGNGERGLEDRRRKVLAAAYTQRAWMVYKLARSDRALSASGPASKSTDGGTEDGEDTGNGKVQSELPAELKASDPAELEEWASRDFEKGGRYGNGVAREMAKATNPYAKLCGAIVGEAMRREMGEEGN